jgi:hypothetical protein
VIARRARRDAYGQRMPSTQIGAEPDANPGQHELPPPQPVHGHALQKSST